MKERRRSAEFDGGAMSEKSVCKTKKGTIGKDEAKVEAESEEEMRREKDRARNETDGQNEQRESGKRKRLKGPGTEGRDEDRRWHEREQREGATGQERTQKAASQSFCLTPFWLVSWSIWQGRLANQRTRRLGGRSVAQSDRQLAKRAETGLACIPYSTRPGFLGAQEFE